VFAYIVWLFVLDGAFVTLLVLIARRGAVVPFVAHHWKSTLLAGTLGTLSYGLALFAFDLGAIAEISALRETSILFAAIIGALILKEPFVRTRTIAAVIAVAGIIIMHAGR
jgi:drug/metabolite transporter (DMT)-like permease